MLFPAGQIVDKLTALRLVRRAEIQGCTDAEIAIISSELGFPLPMAYREFLLTMGKQAGKLFAGSEIHYPSIVGLRDDAEKLLHENGNPFPLQEDAFVFEMHQGYQFLFFRCSDGDNPPVYHYLEGWDQPRQIHATFSDFILQWIEDYANLKAVRQGSNQGSGQ